MPKRKLTYQDFKKYFSNHLQREDKHAFEKQMMQDAFEEEAFDGLSQLSQFELGNDVAELKADIYNKTQKTSRLVPSWFKYVASVLLLVGVGLSVLYINSNFWDKSDLKDQISQEMEIADSIIISTENANETLAETKTDTVAENPQNFIAENRKEELKNPEQKVDLEIVEDNIELDVVEESGSKNKMEADEDSNLEIAAFEEEEILYDEITENPAIAEVKEPEVNVSSEETVREIQGQVSGVSAETVAKTSKRVKAEVLADSQSTNGYAVEEKEPVKVSAQPPLLVSESNYKKQIVENLDYSKFSDFSGKYTVKVEFTVFSDGSVGNFSLKDIPAPVFSDEIIRVVKDLGNWIPATLNDNKVSSQVEFTLKIEVP